MSWVEEGKTGIRTTGVPKGKLLSTRKVRKLAGIQVTTEYWRHTPCKQPARPGCPEPYSAMPESSVPLFRRRH